MVGTAQARLCPPYEAALVPSFDEIAKHPAHLALGLLDPRLQRRKIRGVAGPRHDAQKILACRVRLESFTDAEPQNLREIMIKPRRRAQDLGLRLRQDAKPRGVVEHVQRRDVENIWLLGGVKELEILSDEIDIDHAAGGVFQVP